MIIGQLKKTKCLVLAALVLAPVAAADPFAELESAINRQKQAAINEKSDFEQWKQARNREFRDYKRLVREEFKAYKQMHQVAVNEYRAEIAKVWKKPEVTSETRWVTYKPGFEQKTVVDFEQSEIRMEWPSSTNSSPAGEAAEEQALNQLLTLTRKQAFEKDQVSQRVETQGRQSLTTFETDEVEDTPILLNYLFGDSNVSDQQKDDLVKHLMSQRKEVAYKESGQDIQALVFPLTQPETVAKNQQIKDSQQQERKKAQAQSGPNTNVWQTRSLGPEAANRLPKKATGLLQAINRENQAYDLSVELILAIIETESAFNPMARSPVPAYGLMQIVPVSAGQDATAKIFGKPRILSPSYLYNAENNVKVGAAYFHILFYGYFKHIDDPRSRLYCSIAAYNTGPGNVSKALTGNSMSLKAASRVANKMDPEQIYQHLMSNLPYEETVHYLRKVVTRLQKYETTLSVQ